MTRRKFGTELCDDDASASRSHTVLYGEQGVRPVSQFARSHDAVFEACLRLFLLASMGYIVSRQ